MQIHVAPSLASLQLSLTLEPVFEKFQRRAGILPDSDFR
jgi:hypothetical protein